MIQLTPLEESLAVKELVQQGMEKGVEKGIEQGLERGLEKGLERGLEQGIKKGQLIGQIQLIQRLLKSPQTSSESLAERPLEELRTTLANLEAELSKDSTVQ